MFEFDPLHVLRKIIENEGKRNNSHKIEQEMKESFVAFHFDHLSDGSVCYRHAIYYVASIGNGG
jgi:hypothetical protein